MLVSIVMTSFGQQNSDPKTKVKTKTHKARKDKSGIDNKIAVSDQAQTSEKSNKTAKKDNGISNK